MTRTKTILTAAALAVAFTGAPGAARVRHSTSGPALAVERPTTSRAPVAPHDDGTDTDDGGDGDDGDEMSMRWPAR